MILEQKKRSDLHQACTRFVPLAGFCAGKGRGERGEREGERDSYHIRETARQTDESLSV